MRPTHTTGNSWERPHNGRLRLPEREQRERISDVRVTAVRLPCVISKSRSIVKTPALQDCHCRSIEQRKNKKTVAIQTARVDQLNTVRLKNEAVLFP